MSNQTKHDVIIIGAGLAGLACTLALSGPQLSIPLRTLIIDAGPPLQQRTYTTDTRGSAITFGSRNLLEALGIWKTISTDAQPFNEIVVTDGYSSASHAPVLLNFLVSSEDNVPSAWMLENGTLLKALSDAVIASDRIDVLSSERVTDYSFDAGQAMITTDNGSVCRASLLVAADGRNSPARASAGIDIASWTYNQSAITLTINHSKPHQGRAEEHFRTDGPFAVLPLTRNRSSLVWVEATEEANRLMKFDKASFLNELRHRIGEHLGEITLGNEPTSWPLGLQIAKHFAASRLALIGDAAHVIHPIAGLGFNLGLKDIAALSECVHSHAKRGQDIGDAAVLNEYEAWRRADTVVVAGMCDALARLFSNDVTPLAIARQAGLRMVDALPPVKRFFLDRAAGTSGRQPTLMTGGQL